MGSGVGVGSGVGLGDGLGDACDPCPLNPDCDGDGWTDWQEAAMDNPGL